LFDLDQLKIVMYRRDAANSQIDRAQTLRQFNRGQGREVILNHGMQFENNVALVTLHVMYSGDIIEEHSLTRQNMRWVHI
jgi:hypothetical protein